MAKYENVVFLQDEEATEALEILNNDGKEATLDYLKQWHFFGEHEEVNELKHGSADKTFEKDNYILSYNTYIGYIGVQYKFE